MLVNVGLPDKTLYTVCCTVDVFLTLAVEVVELSSSHDFF